MEDWCKIMGTKNRLFYIRSRILEKKNIFFIMVLIFIMLISFLCLTFLQFIINYEKDMINNNMRTRTLVVYADNEEDYDKINDFEHVIFNDSTKYLNGNYSDIDELSVDGKIAHIKLLPYIDGYGLGHLENGQIICPKEFYPFSLNDVDEDNDLVANIDYKYIINGDDLIGKTLTIKSSNEDYSDIQVEFIGTYDAASKLNSLHTCYITVDDYDKVTSPYEGEWSGTYVDGTVVVERFEYEGNMVVVDDYKNVDSVANNLINNNFEVVRADAIDKEMLNYYILIPILLCLIILIVCLNLFYSFIKKKIKGRLINYGILKASGYSNNEIYKLELCENTILIFIGMIITFVLYYFVYKFIIQNYLLEIVYNNIRIDIPFLFIFIEFIILLILLAILIAYCLNKTFKRSVLELVRSD